MEAAKADVIISCFITLSGPLCNLSCKALTAGFLVHQPNTGTSESNTPKNTSGASPAEPRPRPGSHAAEPLPGHTPLPPTHFFKGDVNPNISPFILGFFYYYFGWPFGVVFFYFISCSKREGRGNTHLYLNRDLFFSLGFFSPPPSFFFFSFYCFNPVLLTCLANTAMSSLKDSEEQTSPPATPGSLGVHVANSHFSKISAKRGNRGCLKENTTVTHTQKGEGGMKIKYNKIS